MHDIGGLIWGFIVLAGVVSSIVKNAQKASAKRNSSFAPPASKPASLVAQSSGGSGSDVQAQLVTQQYLARRAAFQAQATAQPQTAAPQSQWLPTSAQTPTPLATLAAAAPPIVQRKPVPKPPPKVVIGPNVVIGGLSASESWHQEPTKAPGYRGFLFDQKSSLVRGIIAAEVLGAPIALRETRQV